MHERRILIKSTLSNRHGAYESSFDAVGVVVNKTIGEKVNKGDILGVIFYNKKLDNMEELFINSFKIDKKKRNVKKIIIKTIK